MRADNTSESPNSRNIYDENNKDDVNQHINFRLRSPRNGFIYKGPHHKAFNKKSLGSIPGKSEKILFKDKSNEIKYAFGHKTERFNDKSESQKYSFPGPADYSIDLDEISKNQRKNPSFSIKGYGNGFLSKIDRFDSLREYYEKFSPGPADYASEKNSILDQVKNSPAYKNIYNTGKHSSKKADYINFTNTPGPGQYEVKASDFDVNNDDKKQIKENYFFASQERRKMPFEQIKSFSPGPGRYNFNSFKDFDLIKDANKTSFFFKKNNNNTKDNIDKRENLQRVIYSPVIEKLKNEIDYTKYKVLNDKTNLNVYRDIPPGPGDYNVNIAVNKPNSEFNYNYVFNKAKMLNEMVLDKEKIKQKELEQINILKNIRTKAFIPYFSPFKNLKNSANYIFNSRGPRIDFVDTNHNPGPNYYKPVFPEKKYSFLMKSDDDWIV